MTHSGTLWFRLRKFTFEGEYNDVHPNIRCMDSLVASWTDNAAPLLCKSTPTKFSIGQMGVFKIEGLGFRVLKGSLDQGLPHLGVCGAPSVWKPRNISPRTPYLGLACSAWAVPQLQTRTPRRLNPRLRTLRENLNY